MVRVLGYLVQCLYSKTGALLDQLVLTLIVWKWGRCPTSIEPHKQAIQTFPPPKKIPTTVNTTTNTPTYITTTTTTTTSNQEQNPRIL